MAEDAWNSRDPQRVALGYTPDSIWRNRAEFFAGRPRTLTREMGGEIPTRLLKRQSRVRLGAQGRGARRILGLPLLTWTVRSAEQRRTAERYADQMIFEGFRP